MKKRLLALAALSIVAASTVARADDPVQHPPVPISVQKILAPAGFDSNDEAEVILDGYLPSTCWRLSHNTATVEQATGAIEITQYARQTNGPCLPAKVPFTSEAAIGLLPAGQYRVSARGAPSRVLHIVAATVSGLDDFLYAPVDAVRVEVDQAAGGYVATLTGRLTNSCLVWDDVKVLDQGDVVVLLPVLKAADIATCATDTAEIEFKRQVPLPTGMMSGRHLLHVRSLNGKAVNTMFKVGT